jgi:hypothetical protein
MISSLRPSSRPWTVSSRSSVPGFEQPGGRSHSGHNFILFGTPGNYFVTHLTTFNYPHDATVVLKVTPQGGLPALDGEKAIWFAPGVSLNDLVNGLVPELTGPLRSHDVGGPGTIELGEMTFSIDSVVAAEVLTPNGRAPASLEYKLLGEGEGTYLVHQPTRLPGFQQVVQVTIDGAAVPAGATVVIPGRDNGQLADALKAGETVVALVNGRETTVEVVDIVDEVQLAPPRPHPHHE